MNGGWKWFWRVLGILGGTTMLTFLAQTWASLRSIDIVPAVQGRPVQDGLDIISIQLDILSLIIAVVGIALAVAGVVGYQSIKAAATAKADEVATAAFALHMANKDKTGTDGGTQPTIEPSGVVEIKSDEEKGA